MYNFDKKKYTDQPYYNKLDISVIRPQSPLKIIFLHMGRE